MEGAPGGVGAGKSGTTGGGVVRARGEQRWVGLKKRGDSGRIDRGTPEGGLKSEGGESKIAGIAKAKKEKTPTRGTLKTRP